MEKFSVLKHFKGAPGLRLFGLGPKFVPCHGLVKLKNLLDTNTTWAKNRNIQDLRKCLYYSDVIVSIWVGKKIVGFGRALSDGIYRGVLWDIVIDKNHRGNGYGKIVVNTLLDSKKIKKTQKIYLMTSNKKKFYCQLEFKEVTSQNLLIKELKI